MLDLNKIPYRDFPSYHHLIETFYTDTLEIFNRPKNFLLYRTFPIFEREVVENLIGDGGDWYCNLVFIDPKEVTFFGMNPDADPYYKVSIRFMLPSCLPWIWIYNLKNEKNIMLSDKDTSLFKHSVEFRQIQEYRSSNTPAVLSDKSIEEMVKRQMGDLQESKYGSSEKVASDNKILIKDYASKIHIHLINDAMDELFNNPNS
jgi:hypothetical protein